MDLEIQRYYNLVKLYPTTQIYCPKQFRIISNSEKQINEFDINLTRYLYINTYNSVPPENIWSFYTSLDTNKEFTPEETLETIEVKIGLLKEEKMKVEIVNLEVKPSETFSQVIDKLNSKGFNCKLLINNTFSVNSNAKIGDTKKLNLYTVSL